MPTKTRNRRDPLDPRNVLRSCRWQITHRVNGKLIVNPCNVTYDSRTNDHQLLHAVMAIVRIIKVVLPLAAANRAGTCVTCECLLPWFRRMTCVNCMPINKDDKITIGQLERRAEAISGVKAPKRGWSLSTEIL